MFVYLVISRLWCWICSQVLLLFRVLGEACRPGECASQRAQRITCFCCAPAAGAKLIRSPEVLHGSRWIDFKLPTCIHPTARVQVPNMSVLHARDLRFVSWWKALAGPQKCVKSWPRIFNKSPKSHWFTYLWGPGGPGDVTAEACMWCL